MLDEDCYSRDIIQKYSLSGLLPQNLTLILINKVPDTRR